MAIKFQNYNDSYIAVGKMIDCKESLHQKFHGVFNKNQMGALNNYLCANRKYVHVVKFKPLENDMFDNTVVHLALKNQKEIWKPIHKEFLLNLNIDTKENYVKTLRTLYNTVSNAINDYKNKM